MLHIRTRLSNCTNTTRHTMAWRRCIGSKRKDDSFTPNSHYDYLRPRLSENWGSARLEEVGDLTTPLLPSSIPGHVLMKKIRWLFHANLAIIYSRRYSRDNALEPATRWDNGRTYVLGCTSLPVWGLWMGDFSCRSYGETLRRTPLPLPITRAWLSFLVGLVPTFY